ncbi:MAG: NAD(P)-dependent oxidoreductase [Patescibacteria group bacterium]
MKIFITGGTGFIGKFVVRRLQKAGYQLLVLTKNKIDPSVVFGSENNIKLLQGNLSDIKHFQPIVRRFCPDVAIHLAWEGIPDYGLEASFKNLQYGVNLVSMLGQIGCKMFIGAGSCWEYGAVTGKISENTIPQSVTPFASAKLALKLFGESISAEYGMKFAWARLFFVYGPGQKKTSLIPSVVQSALAEKKIEINNPRGGNDFIYVEDVAEAIFQIARSYKSIPAVVYNIGAGYITSVQYIADLVMKYCGGLVEKKPMAMKVVGFYADISKLSKATGWKPKTKIDTGIKKTISYYKKI